MDPPQLAAGYQSKSNLRLSSKPLELASLLQIADIRVPVIRDMQADFHSKADLPKTIRQQIFSHLCEAGRTARELSQMVGIPEKEVTVHLGHIGKTAAARGKTLIIRPFECLSCGFLFTERKRFTRPGRCPECRSTHIESPVFRIADAR